MGIDFNNIQYNKSIGARVAKNLFILFNKYFHLFTPHIWYLDTGIYLGRCDHCKKFTQITDIRINGNPSARNYAFNTGNSYLCDECLITSIMREDIAVYDN